MQIRFLTLIAVLDTTHQRTKRRKRNRDTPHKCHNEGEPIVISSHLRISQTTSEAEELTEIEDDLDSDTWAKLKRGVLLEIDVQLAVPQMARLLADPAGFSNLVSLVKAFSPSSITPDTEKVIAGISTLLQVSGASETTLTAIGSPPGSPYRFIMRLNQNSIIGGAELEGEAILVGKLTRKLKETDKELIIDAPGFSVLSADTMRTLSSQPGSEELVVQGPGAIVVPLAIFR